MGDDDTQVQDTPVNGDQSEPAQEAPVEPTPEDTPQV